MRTKVIFEDKDIIVIHKPAGLAVQSARVGQPDVASELKKYLVSQGMPPYLGIIHRLDQPVEGLLVFAKNNKAASALSAQLQKDDFCKEYLAVVCGKPAAEEAELVDYLLKEGSMARVVSPCRDYGIGEQSASSSGADAGKAPAGEQGKKAVLRYRILDTAEADGQTFSLLKVQLWTGRFHQIRVQLSHAGFPILGDRKYGSEESNLLTDSLQVKQTALFAGRLQFIHPISHKKMEYTAVPENPVFTLFPA